MTGLPRFISSRQAGNLPNSCSADYYAELWTEAICNEWSRYLSHPLQFGPLHFGLSSANHPLRVNSCYFWVQVVRIVWQPNHGIICDGGRHRALNGHWRPARPKERECYREPRRYLNQQRRSKD